jgi:peptidylprolyl isomerase
MLPKSERRKLGKIAKAKRRAAERRRWLLNNVAVPAAGVVVLVVILLAVFGVFSPKKPDNSAGSSPTALPACAASASPATPSPAAAVTPPATLPSFTIPEGADPGLYYKPTVEAGTCSPTKKVITTTLIQGTGPEVKANQTITVNYVGVTLLDGKQFDASWDHGQTFDTVIGAGAVIKGWDDGLVGVKVGSRVQLDIPKALAYPDADPSSGAPVGDLRFVVDVLGAKDAAAATPTASATP